LYFETSKEDELRKLGYIKDGGLPYHFILQRQAHKALDVIADHPYKKLNELLLGIWRLSCL
jgi:hypothetical protein